MKMKLFATNWETLKKRAYLSNISNIILAVVVLMLAGGLLKKAPVVTLVPPGLTKEASIGLRTADANYLMSFGMYVASLTGNLTPNNAKLVADALGSIVEPKLYSKVRRELYALAEDPSFKDRGGALFFEPLGVTYDAPTGKVFVRGNQVSVTAAGKQNRTLFIYEIQMEVREHMPMIIGFDKYTGQPHTQEWESQNRALANKLEAERVSEQDASTPWFTNEIRYGGGFSAQDDDGNDPEDEIEPTTNGENQ